MTILVTILHVLVCLVLIIVILVQGGRGQGLSGPSFSSGNVQSLFGTQAADFLTKATSVSAICFLFTCITLNFIETRKSKSLLEGSRQAAPVDIDAVKKALEKVKAEAGATTANTSEAAKNEVAAIIDNVKKDIQEASADAAKVIDEKTAEAEKSLAQATDDAAKKLSDLSEDAKKNAAELQAANTQASPKP